jgi:hypothetical protein
MRFDLKQKLDLFILIAAVVLVTTGAFLRFFKYLLTPETTKNITYFLIPEFVILIILVTIKLWRK